MKTRLGALLTHPIQYYSPWLKALAQVSDLTVYYAHQQTAQGQADAGFATPFEWDIPLLDGYDWRWLNNVAKKPGLSTFGGCDTPEIGSIIREEKFAAFIMFGWNYKCFVQAAWAASRNATPVLVRVDSQLATPRATWKRAAKKLVYSAILPRLGHYMSPGVRTDDYLRHYSVPPDRIHRVAHMVDTERFAAESGRAQSTGQVAELRIRNGASPGDFILLFVGKLIDRKRPMLALQALHRLREIAPGRFSHLKLWIAGDGPLSEELTQFAKAHALPVTFLGFANQSALPGIYAAADCLVLPSNAQETWGLVVNEAFACGIPAIVSSEAGCAPDLIEEGATGWTLHQFEADALARLYIAAAEAPRGLAADRIADLTRRSSYSAGVSEVMDIVRRLRAELIAT